MVKPHVESSPQDGLLARKDVAMPPMHSTINSQDPILEVSDTTKDVAGQCGEHEDWGTNTSMSVQEAAVEVLHPDTLHHISTITNDFISSSAQDGSEENSVAKAFLAPSDTLRTGRDSSSGLVRPVHKPARVKSPSHSDFLRQLNAIPLNRQWQWTGVALRGLLDALLPSQRQEHLLHARTAFVTAWKRKLEGRITPTLIAQLLKDMHAQSIPNLYPE